MAEWIRASITDKEVRLATEEKAWYKNKVWYFFNSLKLTLAVLITLAVVSILGTLIEQNLTESQYVARYGAKWYKVISALRLSDMYHAKWFLFLLAMLTLNIVVCTFERFPPKWKSLLNHKPRGFDPDAFSRLIGNCSHNHTLRLAEGAAPVKGRVFDALKKKGFSIVSYEGNGGYGLYAWKGAIGRLGSDFTHISLLLILLGAIVGNFTGFKDYKVINVGETIDIPKADFKVRLDKFWIDYYETGQIRQYNSMLTVVEDGKDVLRQQIWVNEPLYYKGIRFYQSSYGMSWSMVESAKIGIVRKDRGELMSEVTVKWGETAAMPGSDYSVKLVAYTADFAYDEESKTIFSQSPDANNPAIGIEIYKKGDLVNTGWLFLKYPGILPVLRDNDKDLVFTDYAGVRYSGISLNKDPGTNIVWLGSIVMGVGFILAFFIFHRRVWVNIKADGNYAEMKIGGIINKNNLAFERELKEIVDDVSGPERSRQGDQA